MIRVTITKNGNKLGTKDFETQELVDAWVNSGNLPASFGLPERWVKDDPNDEQNEANKTAALETRDLELMPAVPESVDEETGEIHPALPAITVKQYKLAAEFTLQQVDVSAQLASEALIVEGKKRQALGAGVLAKVYSINEGKNITPQQFAAMFADANLERIERMLWTGSLRTAKLMIQALDNTYFTTNEKNSILAMLADY